MVGGGLLRSGIRKVLADAIPDSTGDDAVSTGGAVTTSDGITASFGFRMSRRSMSSVKASSADEISSDSLSSGIDFGSAWATLSEDDEDGD